VIKFVSDLRQVGGFLLLLLFPPTIKLYLFCYIFTFLALNNSGKYNLAYRIPFIQCLVWQVSVYVFCCFF